MGVRIVLGLAVFGTIVACAEINHLRDAQDAFDRAARAENELRLNLEPESDGTSTMTASARTGYTSALVSLDKLNNDDISKLKQSKLLGNVLALKAMAQWRLQQYDQAKQTADDARNLQPEEIAPRDKAILEALPGLIRIDQVYSFISFKSITGNMSTDDFQRDVVTPLSSAEDIIGAARNFAAPNAPVQVYLVQAQLAGYRNLKTAYRKFRPERDTVPSDHPLKTKARASLQDLSDVLLALLGEDPQRSRLVQYWVVLTGLPAPDQSCQNREICG